MSKELEALKQMSAYRLEMGVAVKDLPNYEIIETALKRLEELEKAFKALSKEDEKAKKLLSKEIEKNLALEIIKNKRVNLEYIKCCENYEQYKTVCSYWNEITQEEFESLKGVLL